ncbi:PTS system glucose-specific EIICBA component [Clostridium tepidiprofundi DSM 19306]|uniref:PTS system glucose-specific EIICBA component n=1 Tax=Clostridium tepidiprofundi DSM 19306 TaxID=1121338 RepID=A0A151B3D0_9CLOT|nr:PTS transporter subunit IIABC [Clostridium tepidiprofundi]KYH34293.1 PTS system glucose-specific EIICBA component [Clostridium tepidiprofundi DSM 19306]
MKKKGSRAFAILQKVGKSLMLPVSVLPAAGLLVAFGRIIQNIAVGPNGQVANAMLNAIGSIMFKGGIAIFEQLPLIFAIGVAIGFAAGEGVAGLAAGVGYFIMINVLKIMGELRGLPFKIDTGVFGGIIMGLIAANLYKKFFKTKLHPVLGFFEGKRLVPIITAFVAMILGIALGFIWPPIQGAINAFGKSVLDAKIAGFSLSGGIFAAGNRALIPTGLHHVFYAPFLFDFGTFTNAAGEVFRGESARYFAGDPTAGAIMASEYPLKIFGLPAAALAMTLTADKKNRKAVGGVMLTAALTSIITGITEPIEFAFIFVAPILYVAHVLLAFVSGFLINLFHIRLGYTFTSSLIDFFISYFNAGNPWKLFYIVGPIIGVLYFVVFYYAIKKFNLKTPGRGEDLESEALNISASQKALEVLKALGDAANIKHIDACITRLRLELNDSSMVDKNRLKALGSAGVMDAGGGSVQVVFGTEAEALKDEIKSIIAAGGAKAFENVNKEAAMDSENVSNKNGMNATVSKSKSGKNGAVSRNSKSGEEIIVSPMKGKIVDISEVPDATFAEKLLGEGIAIEPVDGIVTSPVNGKITQLFRTKHAVGIMTDLGAELLIHIGIDTVKMNGEGFEAFVKQGDEVKVGDKLLKVDLELVKKKAKSTISPIVITNTSEFKSIDKIAKGNVNCKDNMLKIVK